MCMPLCAVIDRAHKLEHPVDPISIRFREMRFHLKSHIYQFYFSILLHIIAWLASQCVIWFAFDVVILRWQCLLCSQGIGVVRCLLTSTRLQSFFFAPSYQSWSRAAIESISSKDARAKLIPSVRLKRWSSECLSWLKYAHYAQLGCWKKHVLLPGWR